MFICSLSVILSLALSQQQKRHLCLEFQMLRFPFKPRYFRKGMYFYTWPCRLNTSKTGLFTQTLTQNKNSCSLSPERHKAVQSLLSKPPVTTYSYKSPLQARSRPPESQSPPSTLCSLLPFSQHFCVFKLGTCIMWTIITAISLAQNVLFYNCCKHYFTCQLAWYLQAILSESCCHSFFSHQYN